MGNAPGSFIWYELMTTDANAAAKFYGDVVGWKIPATPVAGQPPGRDYRMIGRSDGGSAGGVLQLTDDMLQGGAHPLWLGYLFVRNVDDAVKAIEADGGKLLMPRISMPVGEIAMVTDPMGTPLYVMTPIPPPGKPDARSDVFDGSAPQHVQWNELASRDLAQAKSFYAKHFDFHFNEVMPMGPMGDYCFIDHDGQRIGAIMQNSGSSPATWLFYFGVESITQATRALTEGGGTVLMGPHEVPGGSWITVATDPQGAHFGIVGPKGE